MLYRITTRVAHPKSLVRFGERTEKAVPPYVRNPRKNSFLPGKRLSEPPPSSRKTSRRLRNTPARALNRMELNGGKVGVVTASIAYEYAKDAFPEDTSFLKLGITNPCRWRSSANSPRKVEKLYVIEELDPFMEDQIRAAGIPCDGQGLTGKLYELNPQLLRERIFGDAPRPWTSASRRVPSARSVPRLPAPRLLLYDVPPQGLCRRGRYRLLYPRLCASSERAGQLRVHGRRLHRRHGHMPRPLRPPARPTRRSSASWATPRSSTAA